MKKNHLFILLLVVVVLLLAVFFLGSLFDKKEPQKETAVEGEVEQPNEPPSGFSFSSDEKIRLFRDKEDIYVLGNTLKKVNWDEKSLEETDYVEKIYDKNGLAFGISEGTLYLLEPTKKTPMVEGILESKSYEDKLLYRNEKGIALFYYEKKISQQLMENIEGKETLKLDNLQLIDHGKYYAYYDEENSRTEIHLTETLEHVSNFDGKISSASWTSDAFLFEDMENINRVGYYSISTEEVSKFSLTTDNEKVLYSPTFDEHGMVRYISDKEGVVHLNKLDVQTQMVKKISMAKREDFKKEDKIDGYVVLQFKDRFYYSKDDVDFSFYTVPNEGIAFSDNNIYVAEGNNLKAIRGDSFKSYSLKGKPTALLGTDSALYYTYLQDGKQWMDRIKIDL